MNIGYVAKKTGLTSKTIRFYEEKGLVTPPLRGENGYRHYTEQHLQELTLLRHARKVGFNLDECREMLSLYKNPARQSAVVKARTLQKIASIEADIAALQRIRQHLLALVDACPGDDGAECPIINHLAGGDLHAVDDRAD